MILLNFLLPVIFLLSVGILIHSIYLFLKVKGSRKKAVKRAILPLAYIVGTLSFFNYQKQKTRSILKNEIPGTYTGISNKTIDSSRFHHLPIQILINSDREFQIVNRSFPDSSKTGHWEIQGEPDSIILFLEPGKILLKGIIKRQKSGLAIFFTDSTIFSKAD